MDVSGLDALVEGCDWQRLDEVLAGLPATDRATATRWYRRSGRAHARRVADRDWRGHSRVVQLLLALTLAETPEEASRNCQWGSRFLWRDDDLAASTCADALIRRGRDWSAEFVRLATEARFRGESQRGVGEVVALVSAAIAAHDLPMPLTETYVRGWVSLITFAHSYAMADNRRDWHPLVVMTAQEGTARPAYNLSENLTLSECLAGTRSLSELLVAGLATPNALLDWAGFREEGWAVGPAIRYAVSTGLVDRQPLLDGTFSALSG